MKNVLAGDKDDFQIQSHLQQLDETTDCTMQPQINEFEKPGDDCPMPPQVQTSHSSEQPSNTETSFIVFNSKMDLLTRVLQIHEEGSKNAPPEALIIHAKLLEDLAPLFSEVAVMLTNLDCNMQIEQTKLSENYLATIFRWTQFINKLRKCRLIIFCTQKIQSVHNSTEKVQKGPKNIFLVEPDSIT